MLDNRNSGLDPSFIDTAWEDMRRQLDVAMPVESKKKRPLLIWWWAAAIVLPLALAIGLWPNAEKPELEALPIPGHTRAIAGPKVNAPATLPIDGETATQLIPNNSPLISNKSQDPSKSDQSNTAATSNGLVSQPPLSNETKPQLPIYNESKQLDLPKQLERKINPSTVVQSEQEPPTDRKLMPSLLALPSWKATDLPTTAFPMEKEVKTSPVNSRYAIEVGTSTRSFLGLEGFFIGINKEWQKAGSRWSFGTGIQYRKQLIPFQNTNLSRVNGSGKLFSASADVPIMEESFQNNVGNANVDISAGVARFHNGDTIVNISISSLNVVQQLHYIDIPAYAEYRLGKRWQAFASVRLSILAKAYLDHSQRTFTRNESSFNSLDVSHGGGAFDPTAVFYVGHQNASIRLGTNTGDFHNTMLSGALGITYYPSPEIGFRLQYSSTPTSLYKLASINTRDHWLGSSLIWRF